MVVFLLMQKPLFQPHLKSLTGKQYNKYFDYFGKNSLRPSFKVFLQFFVFVIF